MAGVDTKPKRLSIMRIGSPDRGLPAVPDGSIDRLVPLLLYTGIAAGSPGVGSIGPSVATAIQAFFGIAVSWAGTGNTAAADNVYATVNLDGALPPFDRSNLLGLITFSPSLVLPAGGIVDGVTVAIERKASNLLEVTDLTVRLLSGGAFIGTNKADTVTTWPNADAAVTYGGAADLWGVDFDTTPIDATFGVAIAVRTVGAGAVTASIDLVTITVNYHIPAVVVVPGTASSAADRLTVAATAVHTLTHAPVAVHTLTHDPVGVHTLTHGGI
jgi:hypothetical protein